MNYGETPDYMSGGAGYLDTPQPMPPMGVPTPQQPNRPFEGAVSGAPSPAMQGPAGPSAPQPMQGPAVQQQVPQGQPVQGRPMQGLYTEPTRGGRMAGMTVTNPAGGPPVQVNMVQPLTHLTGQPGAPTPITRLTPATDPAYHGPLQGPGKRKAKRHRDVNFTAQGGYVWRVRQYADESVEVLRAPSVELDREYQGRRLTQQTDPSMWGDIVANIGSFRDYKRKQRKKGARGALEALTAGAQAASGMLGSRKGGGGGGGGKGRGGVPAASGGLLPSWAKWALGGTAVVGVLGLGIWAVTRKSGEE